MLKLPGQSLGFVLCFSLQTRVLRAGCRGHGALTIPPCLLWGHASIPWGGSGCALKVFSLCKTPSLQTKAFVIVLPGLQKYRSPTTRNVKVK